MRPDRQKQMLAYLTRPAMAQGGRIGFAKGPPGLTKRQRTKAKYLESIPGYLDNDTFASLRMENSDMTNNQFAEFLNDNGYKPDTRQADKFKGTTIDRRYNVAVENGLIPKDFVFAGSAADRAITETDVEKYKKFFLKKNKNKPEKIKKFNQLSFEELKKRVSDQRKYEKAAQDPEYLIKKAKKGREYRARIKAEGGEAYERYLETVAKINRENRSDRNVFYRNNRDGKSMLWEDLLKRNEEGKTKFFKYEKPLPKKQGGYYDKATTQNIVLIDDKGNKYKFDTLYEDINKAGYSAESAAKPYNQKAFLYKEGLMPELNRLAGIQTGQRRNPFHVHHVSGVKKNPFDVMLTFEGANINEGNQRGGLTTTLNKILEKEKANPNKPLRYNEKKTAIQKFYSSLDPDIAVKLGKKEVGTRPKLIDMLDKTGVKLTEGQIKEANEIENFLKNLENKKFGRVADVVVKASKEGGFGEAVQTICKRRKAKKGGRMFVSTGSGCPAAKDDPKGFLRSVSENPKLAKFLKSAPGKKAMTMAARVTGNVLNPTTLIGGEVAFVLGDGLNNFASGLPLDESFDRAFVFGDFGQFEKNLINQAKELGYDDNQLNLLQQTININKLDNKRKKLEFGLDKDKSDMSGLTSDATMGFEDRLVNTNKNLDDSVGNYLNTLDNMGFDSNKAADQATGFTYLDNVFKKRTQDQLVKDFEDRKRQVDPTKTPFGDFISPVFDLGSYTQPLKFAADIVNPFTKDVPFLSERQQEAKKLREMSEEKLDAYNKARGFTIEDIQQGTSPQIRETMDYLGTDVTGQGFGQSLAGGGIAKLAGDSSGRPPESGPNSQGLLSLKNRVRNY